jgi:hypothetical protein
VVRCNASACAGCGAACVIACTSLSLPLRVFNSAYSRGCCSLASAPGSSIVRGAMLSGLRK